MTTPDPPTTPEPAAAPPPPRTGWRRAVPRRRGTIIGLSVLGVVVVAAIVAGFLLDRPDGRDGRGFGPGDRGTARGFDGFGGPGSGHGGGPGFDGRGFGEGRGPGGRDGAGLIGARLGDDTLIAGTVVSAGGGTLVVTPDGAPQRTLRTDDDTRVLGGDNRTLADLTAGERVLLRVDGTGADATVVAAYAPQARVTGTVTAITGNQATVVSVDGLTVTVDVTAIGQKPVAGDLVELTGGASGATLRADELRVLPKTP